MNLTEKLIERRLQGGTPKPGTEVELAVDQCLLQDATGTLVMLELEAMDVDRVQVDLACQYVDHNLIQVDHRNPDDHVYLHSACRRYGIHFSRPGNGVSHPVHMQRFGVPGRTLVGSDSHTCAAGGLGMLAFGSGGIDVAAALAGQPLRLVMPEVWGVELTGSLPDWVSAKDVILELLRRFDVDGCVGCILEYRGPGLADLDVWDRHVIANMGAELGATTSVFPSDLQTRQFLEQQDRAGDWIEMGADPGADYHKEVRIELSGLEPLIAEPSSPGNVVRVRDVAGRPLHQAYLGSSANPGYRDFAIAARMVSGRTVDPSVSFDVNPTTRGILDALTESGLLSALIRSGARIHQAGCNGCIGMGQAPATGRNSLRTVPRNFPGRSGTSEDSVFLCSPETATASALRGEITDPRDLRIDYPSVHDLAEPPGASIEDDGRLIIPPLSPAESRAATIVQGPNIAPLPDLDPLPDQLEVEVLLEVGDDVSTDEVLPAGARVLPFRSNIPKIAEFCFDQVDPTYHDRARSLQEADGVTGHGIVAGRNYGQGSSREHAVLAPRSLGLRLVIARSYARIHWQNLVNFGVLPLVVREAGSLGIERGSRLLLQDAHAALRRGSEVVLQDLSTKREVTLRHDLSERQVETLIAGGVINELRSS